MRVGVISDTHGPVPDAALEVFRAEKVDRIIHLGDYGHRSGLVQLEGIAPLTVVRGNNDFDSPHPQSTTIALDGITAYLAHTPLDLQHALKTAPSNEPILGLHGHTHVPRFEKSGNVTIANPGATSRPRAGSGKSVLILDIEGGSISPRFINL